MFKLDDGIIEIEGNYSPQAFVIRAKGHGNEMALNRNEVERLYVGLKQVVHKLRFS